MSGHIAARPPLTDHARPQPWPVDGSGHRGLALPVPLQASSFVGNGASLTNLNTAKLTGTISPSVLGPCGSYSPAISANGVSSFTSTNYGYYANFRNQVYFEARLIWTSQGEASGPVAISLPFPSASFRAAFSISFVNGITNTSQLVGNCNLGDVSLNLEKLSTTGGRPTEISATDCAQSGEIQITGTYRWQ